MRSRLDFCVHLWVGQSEPILWATRADTIIECGPCKKPQKSKCENAKNTQTLPTYVCAFGVPVLLAHANRREAANDCRRTISPPSPTLSFFSSPSLFWCLVGTAQKGAPTFLAKGSPFWDGAYEKGGMNTVRDFFRCPFTVGQKTVRCLALFAPARIDAAGTADPRLLAPVGDGALFARSNARGLLSRCRPRRCRIVLRGRQADHRSARRLSRPTDTKGQGRKKREMGGKDPRCDNVGRWRPENLCRRDRNRQTQKVRRPRHLWPLRVNIDQNESKKRCLLRADVFASVLTARPHRQQNGEGRVDDTGSTDVVQMVEGKKKERCPSAHKRGKMGEKGEKEKGGKGARQCKRPRRASERTARSPESPSIGVGLPHRRRHAAAACGSAWCVGSQKSASRASA